jgi:hypothetical protein
MQSEQLMKESGMLLPKNGIPGSYNSKLYRFPRIRIYLEIIKTHMVVLQRAG